MTILQKSLFCFCLRLFKIKSEILAFFFFYCLTFKMGLLKNNFIKTKRRKYEHVFSIIDSSCMEGIALMKNETYYTK